MLHPYGPALGKGYNNYCTFSQRGLHNIVCLQCMNICMHIGGGENHPMKRDIILYIKFPRGLQRVISWDKSYRAVSMGLFILC